MAARSSLTPEFQRMNLEDWDRLEELFSELIGLAPGDRAARLEDIRVEDPKLVEELVSLLPHDDPDFERFRVVSVVPGPRGNTIGPYRIVRELGSGGMGVVYLAEQQTPVERQVALKVIRAGMDTERVLKRFELEKSTLALMSHPGIARILEAGQTEDGRPYFAMEYVEGTPILEWCDAGRLTIRQRVRLFAQVCRALQHAHDRSVVHRDLKPGNILVTAIDDVALPKLIDFGIARMAEPDATAQTLAGQLLGTPEYMSPEQVRFDASSVDHRSDIYSLGLVLHELLVGDLPYDRSELRTIGPVELQRLVGEREASRPSTRTDLTERFAELRSTTRAQLSHELRGDLDWMVLRALEKDPDHRYPTAAALADDLEAWLEHRPVSATPPSRVYLARKFVRRHRSAVVAASSIFIALLVSLVVSLVLYHRERDRYQRVLLLGDTRRLAELIAGAGALWPASTAMIPALETWVNDAHDLVARLPLHRQGLAELRALSLPYLDTHRERDADGFPLRKELEEARLALANFQKELDQGALSPQRETLTRDFIAEQKALITRFEAELASHRAWEFPTADLRWQHDVLSKLVRDLEMFADRESEALNTVAEVSERLTFARRVVARDFPGYRDAWEHATGALRDAGHGEIVEQPGLLPLGPDPRSGLWEFAVLQTGTIPRRDDSGDLVNDPTSAIVLVLVPGGRFSMGAEPLDLGTELDERLTVDAVTPGAFAAQFGLEVGDRITHIGGQPVTELDPFRETIAAAVASQTLEFRVERGGGSLVLSGRVPDNIDPHAKPEEGPIHPVELESFFISKYEVNQAQWYRMARERPSHFGPMTLYADQRSTELHPVERVSWTDCRDTLARFGLAIPTEAEWEYAARAGTGTPWFTGAEAASLAGFANVLDRTARGAGYRQSASFTLAIEDGYLIDAPVGRFAPNAFGLHDTVGNVWEWCREYLAYYEDREGSRKEAPGLRRVIRGGSWGLPAVDCRSASRALAGPELQTTDFGIRPSRALQR